MIKLKQLLLCEEIDENNIVVISKREGVSIMYRNTLLLISAVVSIDNTNDGKGTWWVSRALVNVVNERGKGIGSILLKRAVKEVLRWQPKAKIIVEPGGSYGSNEKRQINFYKKNGFVDVPGQKGVLIYGGNQ